MIVIIAGMHRSGTSALAGLLHANGVFMGEDQNFLPPPAPENPKGFYENIRFRAVNDLILSQNGYRVKSFSPKTPDLPLYLSDQAKDIIEQLIYEYTKLYPVWGFKDPRLCLTYPAWDKIFKKLKIEPKVILLYREFDNIAKSMMARNNFGTHEQFKSLTKVYYNNFLKCEIQKKIIVKFDNLINNTQETVNNISTFLDHPIIDLSFIEPKLANRNQ